MNPRHTITLPPDLLADVQKIATDNEWSFSKAVQVLLKSAIAHGQPWIAGVAPKTYRLA